MFISDWIVLVLAALRKDPHWE